MGKHHTTVMHSVQKIDRLVLLGFGIVYPIGAVVLAMGFGQISQKNLSVLAFLLPGVVALVAHLEIARLRRQAK